MPTIDDLRAAAEADVSAILRKLNRKHRARVAAAIEQYGSVAAIPAEFWEGIKREIDGQIAAVLLLLMVPAYQGMQRRVARLPGIPKKDGPSVDVADSIRRSAARRAAELGREAADAHVEYTRQRIETAERNAEGDAKAFDKSLADIMRVRPKPGERDAAETTAITTSTRGISTAERSAVSDEGARRGVQVDVKWVTERDGKVCPICRPLHGKPSIDWVDQHPVGPPAHPNCRCELKPFYTPEPSVN